MPVFVEQGMCQFWVHCTHSVSDYCEMVATAAGNKVSKHLEAA